MQENEKRIKKALSLVQLGLEYDVDQMYILETVEGVLRGVITDPSLDPKRYK